MEYSPKDVAYCCIYLACKSEEHHLPLEKMIADITAASNPAAAAAAADPSAAASTVASNAKTVSTVLSLEVPVLSELKFQLRLYHLGRSSRGLVKELEETEPLQMSQGIYVNATDPALTSKGTPGTTLQSVSQYLSARATVLHDAALLTDAIFLHSPAQIALGCLVQAEQEAKTFAVDAQLDTSALGSTAQGAVKRLTVVQMFIEKNAQANSANPSPLAAKLASVQSFLTSGLSSPSSIDKKSLKSIEKRRKLLSNPSRDPNSAAAVQEQLERGHAKERKRAEKKRGQREEAGRREDALLMDDDPPAPEAPKAEFTISKRQKSLAGTPVSKHDLAAAGESDAMKDVDAPRSSMRLASQFDDAME
jgi:hypothetical protein